ncbi:MAG TPA: amino acid ABC transporter permease [Dehalococcoidales bacterium]|nr:amino acid ABC transporter permease [Dehalococcoidales bacterium]
MDWAVIPKNIYFLLGGLGLTFELAAISIVGGLLVGIIMGLGRVSSRRWIYYPASLYVNFFRSLPLILVIFWFYFLMPFILGRPLGDFLSAVIAFIIFESSYFAEIVRAGIGSIRKEQVFAGYSTGLNYYKTMRHIVIPQALRNMVPSLVTQCVIIFQDTSLAYVIGLKEFLRRTALVDATQFRSIELYSFAAIVYLVFCFAGSMASRRLEKRRGQGRR